MTEPSDTPQVHDRAPMTLDEFIDLLSKINIDLSELTDLSPEMFHHLRLQLQSYIGRTALDILQIGKMLDVVQRTRAYTADGHASFKQWIHNDPDINIGVRNAFNFLRMYRACKPLFLQFTDIDLLLNIGPYRLRLVAPKIGEATTNDEKLEWLHKAKTLTHEELLIETKGGVEHEVSIRGRGKLYRLMHDKAGYTITVTSAKLHYTDASPQNYWDVMGNKEVQFIIKPCKPHEE